MTGVEITVAEGSGYVGLTFTPIGVAPSRTTLLFGVLQDGVVVSGDGVELGRLEAGITYTLYEDGRIDPSSITTPVLAGVRAGTEVAVFAVWTDSESSELQAAGLSGVLNSTGFQHRPISESADAFAFLDGAGFVLPDATVETDPDMGVYFSELSVAGFRGFADERSLQLARPNDERGSGLTFIVGANNSGKSTFIEALHAIARGRVQREVDFSQLRRHRDLDQVTMTLRRSDGRALEVASIRRGTSQAVARWLPQDSAPDLFDVHITPSRRNFAPYFGAMGMSDRNWGLTSGELSRTELRNQFVNRLRAVNGDPDRRQRFDDLLFEIVGYPLTWTIDQFDNNQQFVKLTEPTGAWHTSEGLGDGLVSLLFIVDALYDSEPGALIAIDEPESSLHPQLIRRLRIVLARYASARQIIVATHSPLLIDWTDIANGAAVARVYKSDGRSEVGQASSATLQAVARLADHRNANNPHVVGVVAREAFFLEDGVILTEGQDDVVYLPRILRDLGLPEVDNLYGWGAGGATNIPDIAQLFIELGFTRIGAVLDDDGHPETEKAVTRLAEMTPQVVVRQIPAPDVRYKKPVSPRVEVEGLLEKDGRRVRAELRDRTTQVLREIIDHVTPVPGSAADKS